MFWFILSLLTALAVACRDVTIKASHDLSALDAAALELLWAVPFLMVGFLTIPKPDLDAVFWKSFLLSIPLNVIPYFLYLYAIKISPLSLTVPFLSFTPLFMLFTGYVTLAESVSIWGGLGVISIVVGSYILNLRHATKGFLEPVKALFYEKGSILMLSVAFFYSFASVIGKKAILHSSPLYFSYLFFLVFASLILIGLFVSGKVNLQILFANKGKGILLGSLLMCHVSTHALAIAISTAVYMIAVKRSSILISMVLSWIVLKEGDVINRGLGALLMFSGLVLITIYG